MKPTSKDLSLSLSKVCLTGKGRVRIETPREKQVFHFESIYDAKAPQWDMAASFPLYGEKTMKLTWDRETKESLYEGDLYSKHLRPLMQLKGKNGKNLDVALQAMGAFIYLRGLLARNEKDFLSSCLNKGEILSCSFGKRTLSLRYNEGLQATSSFENSDFILQGKFEKDGFYRKISFFPKQLNNVSRNIRINFFVSDCFL